jgi:HD-GYP domain-containing protein (c-di-GMP phosphodiesterase class II)
MPVKKIPTADVRIGMFVSSLDRPWSETTFLFQGFEVRDQEDIEALLRYTQHVYIMVPDEEIELRQLPSGPVRTMPGAELLHQEKYTITMDAEQAVEEARDSHEQVSRLVNEIETVVEQGSGLAPEDIGKPIEIMVNSVTGNPDAYIWLTRIRNFDSYVYKDALGASVWATALGRELGLAKKELQKLATGTLLMDIGKMSLPVELLHKKTRLTHDEWKLMKTHVQHGLDILESCGACEPEILDIVRTHHERIDGSGYPAGLRGVDIPLFGQIAGIVDFYAAVTMPRPYAKSISPSMALQLLYDQKGIYFDRELVENFIQVLSTYPTGSLVELSSGEIAVVTSQNPGLRLKPNLVLLLNPDKRPYDAYPMVSLAHYTYGPEEQPVHVVRTLPDGEFGLNVEELAL